MVYDRNITHNLTAMAAEAGIYKHLWRPDENGIEKASQLILPLESALMLMRSDPERFKKHNPPNKWGDFDGFYDFVCSYLEACRSHPDATIRVSR